MKKVEVEKTIIHITQHDKEDYISLTDMLTRLDFFYPINQSFQKKASYKVLKIKHSFNLY